MGVIEPETEWLATTAAWLGVLLERLESGRLPFARIDDPHADHDTACHNEVESIAIPGTLATYPQRFWDVPPSSVVMDRLMRRILAAVKGQPWEETFWDNVLPRISTAIADDVAADLLERGVSVMVLGHQPLSDGMLFRLIDEVEEALLTLAKRRYIHDRYGPYAFEEVLNTSPKHEWMLSSLIMLEPSHVEKAQCLAEYVARHKPPLAWPKRVSHAFKAAWDAR